MYRLSIRLKKYINALQFLKLRLIIYLQIDYIGCNVFWLKNNPMSYIVLTIAIYRWLEKIFCNLLIHNIL